MAALDLACYVSTKKQKNILHDCEQLKIDSERHKGLKDCWTSFVLQHPKLQTDLDASLCLFQERFAAVDNDIVLSNTRVARHPIMWQVCITIKLITTL